ncbi:MAG: hypothetical protein AB4911_06385 [Oscillochloridaceae bacterium umkhey_bin13]
MTVRGREINQQRDVMRLPRSLEATAYGVTFVLAAVAIYLIVGTVINWGQVRLDDLRYGMPRTTHLEGTIGHSAELSGQATRFIGLNLERQIVVLVLPGGDASQVQSLPGPYLFGSSEDLVPVLLSLRDVDRDERPDLVVYVRNEQLVYLNRDEGFRLPTPEEQRQLVQEQQP